MTTNKPLAPASRARRRLGTLAMIASLGIGAAFAVSSPATAGRHRTDRPRHHHRDGRRPGEPVPVEIEVSDVPGSIVSARVILTDVVHTWTADLNIMLQAPDGTHRPADVGMPAGNDVNGTLTFADGGELLLETRRGRTRSSGPERTPRVGCMPTRSGLHVPVRELVRFARGR